MFYSVLSSWNKNLKQIFRNISWNWEKLVKLGICFFREPDGWQNSSKNLTRILVENADNFKFTINRRACGQGDMGTGPHHVLTATSTLLQPGGEADSAHLILMFWKPQARLL